MGICNSAKILAQSILDSEIVLDSRQILQIELLKLGPLYLNINNLPLWETAFQSTLLDKDDETKAGVLINEVYELAMINMYGAFDIHRTKECGNQVVDAFNINGVKISINQLELECW